MPWRVTGPMEERKKFVQRILCGDQMADVCREFGISRKTGYKIYNRFLEQGSQGLGDQSRRPRRLGNLLDTGMSNLILQLKQEKPNWGAPKLRELMIRKYPGVNPPAISTIHSLLERNGLVKSRKRRDKAYKASGTYLSVPSEPNDLWCTDFKGQFYLGNRALCYPLTITDQVSRHVLQIEAMEKISEEEATGVFRSVFREYGLPKGIRSDNGVPFSSRSIFGLSTLSVWWLRLGIKLERIVPGHPEQNGRHERMHRTLKQSTTKPPAQNILAQQEKFDAFIEEFNTERPHEGLKMKTPAEVYRTSPRQYPEVLPELVYPNHDQALRVSKCGSIYLRNRQRVFVGTPLGGEYLGLTQIDTELWSVSFMEYELGYFDNQSWKFCPAPENPFNLN